jgi:hypothetical protein
VNIKNLKPIHASQIRVRFRAEEVATAKVREYGLEAKIERIDQVTTTHFDVSTKVWGTEPSGKMILYFECAVQIVNVFIFICSLFNEFLGNH